MKRGTDRLREIFAGALALPPADRAAYLEQACKDDAALRQEVENLLHAHDQSGNFLEAPAPATEETISIEGPLLEKSLDPGAIIGQKLRYFGDYELVEKIAHGGMGVVYKARQVKLNRTVAVKMILTGRFAGEAEVQRFLTEAEAAANLQHPNIVAIHEVGEHEGQHYYSMDYVAGKNLAEFTRDMTLAPTRAAQMVKTIAEAVQYAHQRGILHRDLKPQNVLIDADGQPHITDFGLAKRVDSAKDLTKTGDVMGSPSYMPPEQATGKRALIGPPTDVYAMGAILYHLLTGQAPFTAETSVGTLHKVLEDEPASPKKLNPRTPSDLETICLKCLEKHPERRYPTARALAEELDRFLTHEPILAKPASVWRKAWSWTQRNPWVFAGVGGLLALALLCVAYGLWEQTQVLHWKLAAAQTTPPPATREAFASANPIAAPAKPASQVIRPKISAPGMLFFVLFPIFALLIHFVGRSFRRCHRSQVELGAPVPGWRLVLHATVGLLGAAVAMTYLLLDIRAWMWQASAPLGLEIIGAFCAVTLAWTGLRMAWEAIGIHETSRYRELVAQALEEETAIIARKLPLMKFFAVGAFLSAPLVLAGFALVGKAEAREWVARITGASLSVAVTALATWAVTHRRRIFIFVCMPLWIAIPALVLISFTTAPENCPRLLLLDISCAAETVAVMLLFLTRKARFSQPAPFPVSPRLELFRGVASFLAVFALFHIVEDWRGARAWGKAKREVESHGGDLNWDHYIPAPVDEGQNIFGTPYMQENFTGRGVTPFSKSLGASFPWAPIVDVPVALITVVATNQGSVPEGAVWFRGPATTSKVGLSITNASGPLVEVPLGFAMTARSTGDIQPGTVILISDQTLTPKDIGCVLPAAPALAKFEVKQNGPASFQVLLRGLFSASDVIAWHRRSETNFDIVRQALRRPVARMEGAYNNPFEIPIPNFVSCRAMSQALGAVAQANLLRDDPKSAIDQLTLIHEMRRLLEGPPNGQPETLVASMINVAIAGLYVNMIRDGLRLGAWREPQLEVLQRQLAELDLPKFVRRSFECEAASAVTTTDIIASDPKDFGSTLFGFDQKKLPWWDGRRLGFALVPTGWVNQNKAFYLEARPDISGSFYGADHLIHSRALDDWPMEQKVTAGFVPYTYLARIALPNFVKAESVTAQNQSYVGQAQIACALERCRLAHGEYPATLAALVPDFIGKIPRDIIDGKEPTYRRTEAGFELSSAGWKENERWSWPPQ